MANLAFPKTEELRSKTNYLTTGNRIIMMSVGFITWRFETAITFLFERIEQSLYTKYFIKQLEVINFMLTFYLVYVCQKLKQGHGLSSWIPQTVIPPTL